MRRIQVVGEGQMARAFSPIASLTDTPEEPCELSRPPEAVSLAVPQHEAPADFSRATNPRSGSLSADPEANSRAQGVGLSAVSGTGP